MIPFLIGLGAGTLIGFMTAVTSILKGDIKIDLVKADGSNFHINRGRPDFLFDNQIGQ